MNDDVSQLAPLLLLGAVVAGWIVQTLLSWRQSKAFARDTARLRHSGQVSVGSGGRRYRGGRAFVAIAVDERGTVRDALVLRGWTTAARARPLPEVVGRRAEHLVRRGGPEDLPEPTREAARQAAELLLAARRSARNAKEATTTTA
ncbi:MAG TPA: transcriptional regulator GutM [Actinomycetales bacterium]